MPATLMQSIPKQPIPKQPVIKTTTNSKRASQTSDATYIHPSRLAMMHSNVTHKPELPTIKPVKTPATESEILDSFNKFAASTSFILNARTTELLHNDFSHRIDFGLEKLVRIGDYLFIRTGSRYMKLDASDATSMTQTLAQQSHFVGLARKQLKKWAKHETKEILDSFVKSLGTTQFNAILSTLLTYLRAGKTTAKPKSKKQKHKLEDISVKSNTNSCNKRKRSFECMGYGGTDYGVIQQPPTHKRRIECDLGKDCCWYCNATLPENDRYRCSRCKKAWYCGSKCQFNHWTVHEPNCTGSINDTVDWCASLDTENLTKREGKNVREWNWYSIIFWLNRAEHGRFNNLEYLNLRKHIFIGKIKGYQLGDINDITLNMIGINDYNQHRNILNAIAELLMECDFENTAVNMFQMEVDIPIKYLDPISYELMDDPVTVRKANCYERKCIRQYVKQYEMDPLSKQRAELQDIKQNKTLKHEIDAWKKKNIQLIQATEA